jgi:gliding motility-associated transport system permease protein
LKLLVICRRELSSYFGSVTAYILLAVFLLLSGYFFYSDLIFFVLFGGFTLATGLWQFVFLDMRLVAMLILPLVTMRLFAEEKKLGTMELLWTYPVRDSEIVLGKFLAAWLFFLAMLVPTAAAPLVFQHYQPFELAPVLAGYLGMLLLGSAFIACGLFVSSLTENQVVSAMVTYGILVLFWFITWNEEAGTQEVMRLLLGVSLFDRFFNFTRGVIDTKDVAFFVMFVAFFLFLTWQSLATRTWRGVR